ncbi:MAG TPA: nicotinate-nucleotide adenylyltransferase [Acidimicrobiia bacterium]
MRIGILGGTFDPIHIAHLHAAECARHQLGLDRVLVMPAGDPWQKAQRRVTSDEHRVAMCRLAVEGAEGIEVDEREIQRVGPTYTVDTLATFSDEDQLFLILGGDAASRLHTWHRWKEVVNRATIVIVPRPGAPVGDVSGSVQIDMGALEVSGTEIRQRAADGRPFRYLVTRQVYDYIASHGLYAKEQRDDMVG